eukprot:scaffold276_cov116-Isochrysis_galbana.AAC.11
MPIHPRHILVESDPPRRPPQPSRGWPPKLHRHSMHNHRLDARQDLKAPDMRERVEVVQSGAGAHVPLEAGRRRPIQPEDALVRVDVLAVLAVEKRPGVGNDRAAPAAERWSRRREGAHQLVQIDRRPREGLVDAGGVAHAAFRPGGRSRAEAGAACNRLMAAGPGTVGTQARVEQLALREQRGCEAAELARHAVPAVLALAVAVDAVAVVGAARSARLPHPNGSFASQPHSPLYQSVLALAPLVAAVRHAGATPGAPVCRARRASQRPAARRLAIRSRCDRGLVTEHFSPWWGRLMRRRAGRRERGRRPCGCRPRRSGTVGPRAARAARLGAVLGHPELIPRALVVLRPDGALRHVVLARSALDAHAARQ